VSILRPFAAGTVLSVGAAAALARFDAGPVSFPPLSSRQPLASYRALADAAFGNGLELFALVALIFFACFFVAGWRNARRRPPPL
jgi:hypothetical protein